NTVLMALPWWLKRIVKRNIGEREAAFGLIFFWLAYERLDHDWDMQWPWFSLGNVFATQPSWIQWYEYSGMLGGSLWVLLVNLFIDRAIVAWQRRRPPIAALLRAGTALLLIIVPVLFSIVRYNNYAEQGDPVEVVVVQPNIDPYLEVRRCGTDGAARSHAAAGGECDLGQHGARDLSRDRAPGECEPRSAPGPAAIVRALGE